MKTTTKLLILLSICLLCFSCGKEDKKAKTIAKKPVNVTIVTPQSFQSTRIISGQAEAMHDIVLSAETAGQVESLPIRIGKIIKQGDILAKIDEQLAKAQLNSAKANFRLAKTNYNMQKKLRAKKLISFQQFQATQTQKEVAESNYNMANIQYKKTHIKSPINGLVAEKYIDEKEYIAPGMPVCRVANLEKIKITIWVTDTDLPALNKGDKVKTKFTGLKNQVFTGLISSVGSVANQLTRTFPIEIIIDNPKHTIKGGMLCKVSFINARYENVIVVPQDYVLEGEYKYVYVAENNTAILRKVKILASENNKVVIEGVKPLEAIISTGHKQLIDGDKISIQKKGA
jgi:membrane fusion protein, multidrug efflux system